MKSQGIIAVFVFTIALFLNQFKSYAQSDTANIKQSYFKVAANYLSNAVYSGRKDSDVVSYFSPSIGYYNKSGFHVDAGMSLLANSSDAGRIDEIMLEAGYDFSIKDNFDGGFFASKYFYSDNSFAVTSELQGDIGAFFTYNTGLISIGGGANALISTGTDLNLNGNLSHGFSFGGDNNIWTVSPTAEINMGTQSFYRAYYNNRKFSNSSGKKGKGHNSGNGNTGNPKVISFPQQNHFAILDYELSIPITYDAKGWGIFATPVIALPVSPATYAIDGILQKETLSTSFFVKVGAYYKF